MDRRENIEYVVGEEKHLSDLLAGSEVLPLLKSAVRAGASRAEIRDSESGVLWDYGLAAGPLGSSSWPGFRSVRESLFVEGEPSGEVCLAAPENSSASLATIALMTGGALNAVINSNLKRMLTTEIHTQVINQNFDDLLATNARLVESEQKYRDLATDLELRVQERTSELKQAYTSLVAQQQMASIGQLAAGIAHEINNPLGFISSNLHSLQTYLGRFLEMLQFYRQQGSLSDASKREAEALRKKLKIDFILTDMADLFCESIDGAERVKAIVADLKSFSHIDDAGPGSLVIGEEIDRTLGLLVHETPEGTEIVRNYALQGPVNCIGGQLSQVLINLLRNALQCREAGLLIEVSTGEADDEVWFSIADNGPGISEDLKQRVFEPFFTTRDVGGGVGLGLSVVHNILQQWGGRIAVIDRDGGGTIIRVCWPKEKTIG